MIFSRYRLPPVGGLPMGPGAFIADDPPPRDAVEVPRDAPRVLVTGSRHLTTPALVRAALTAIWRELGRPILVIHGACTDREGNLCGADRWAHEWAVEHEPAGITVEPHSADWRRHGRAAGPRRNAEMVAAGATVCLAFPLGESRGTRGCMALAARAGIPVRDYGVPTEVGSR